MLDICAYKLNRKAKEHKVCNEVKVVLQKEISEAIKMSKSNISRNLKHNRDKRNDKYMLDLALRKSDEQKKKMTLNQKFSLKMQKNAKNLLDYGYDAKQIVGRCELEGNYTNISEGNSEICKMWLKECRT